MAKVYLLMGLPGSGKSSWASRKADEHGVIVCSADHYFETEAGWVFDPTKSAEAHNACLRLFDRATKDRTPCVVVDNTNTTHAEIAPYMALALAYGHSVQPCLFLTTVSKAVERNIHNVPREVIERMAASLERTIETWPPWWPEIVQM